MSSGLCDTVKAKNLDECDHRIAQGREHLGGLIAMDTGSIFTHDDIPHPMQLVFDMPMLAPACEHRVEIELFRCQTEHAIIHRAKGLSRSRIVDTSFQTQTLFYAWPIEVTFDIHAGR